MILILDSFIESSTDVEYDVSHFWVHRDNILFFFYNHRDNILNIPN